MDAQITPLELTGGHPEAVVELCRAALDLPDDAAEAPQIVARLLGGESTDARPAPSSFVAVLPDGSVGGVVVGSVAGVLADGTVAGGADGTVAGGADGSASPLDQPTGHVDLLAVHPDLRRRGVGRALLTRVEQALAARGVRRVALAGNPPRYAWPGVDVRYTPAVCLALACGYRHVETAWNMTVDLVDSSPGLLPTDGAEARLADDGVLVRRALPADLPALVDLARAEFFGSWAAEVADSIGGSASGCHLAIRSSGQIIGFAAYGSSRPSWFGPIGTTSAARGLGIGAVLLRRCLRDQRAAGHQRVQIGWVGPVKFYSDVAAARIERVFFQYGKDVTAAD